MNYRQQFYRDCGRWVEYLRTTQEITQQDIESTRRRCMNARRMDMDSAANEMADVLSDRGIW